MAFEKGNRRVMVNGVPFRMDGETYEEARQKVLELLKTDPRMFDLRAQDLGLDADDVEALALVDKKGQGALRGMVRAEAAVNSPVNEALIGAGRGFVNRYRGARQAIAGIFGDEEAAKAIAREDEDERGLYKQLDDAGVGLEDLGEIGTDIAGFLGAAALTGPGVIPMMVTGGALGASDVKNEVPVPGALQGETMIEEGRGTDAMIGAGASVLGPALGAAGRGAVGLGRAAGLGVSRRVSSNLWLRIRALAGNPQAMVNVVDDALSYTAKGSDPGRAVVGRAALDKVQSIVQALPQTGSEGLWAPVAFGVLRNAVKKSTSATSEGVNVFNPATFEREAMAMVKQTGGMFYKPEHQAMVEAIPALARAMQSLPASISPAAAERAAAALALAPDAAAPILQALRMASNPTVKQSLVDALVDHGAQGIANLGRAIPVTGIAGTSSNVATEGAEDLEEVIGARAESRR